MTCINWPTVIAEAILVVDGFDTWVTLRQLHYQLVSRMWLGYPNTQNAYKQLSSRTAELRRRGQFPDLLDRTRAIHRASSWASPSAALAALVAQYRRDRTEGQDVSIFLGVEKSGMVLQLEGWFGELGVPIVALSGYASQSYVRDVVAEVERQGRPAVLLYAGDHDASGEDIDRDFVARTDCWKKVDRVALSAEQVRAYSLPPAPGKSADSRASAFVARHGELRQVELDALAPTVLRDLYSEALDDWWNPDPYARCLDREREDVSTLARLETRPA